jgi:hypothetical protein
MAIQNRFFHEILLGLFNPIMPEMKAAIMNLGLGPRQKDYYSSRLPMKAERTSLHFSVQESVFFVVIDIAERPEIYYPRGQIGRFIGRNGNLWHTPDRTGLLNLIRPRKA